MNILVEIDVNGCADCPFLRREREQGATIDFCGHQKAPRGYGSVLKAVSTRASYAPHWCPLHLNGVPAANPEAVAATEGSDG